MLVLVVCVPFLSTAVLLSHSAYGAWSTRQHADKVAADAVELRQVASARAQLNAIEFPISAVSYAAGIGISEPLLDDLLHPQVPFRVQISTISSQISAEKVISSDSALRQDTASLRNLIREVDKDSVSQAQVLTFFDKMGSDINAVWYRDYSQLQSDIASWQPPGSFDTRASALRQIYSAFLAGGTEVGDVIYVLEGVGPSDSKEQIIQESAIFQDAASQFVRELGSAASTAWERLQKNPSDARFSATMSEAVTVAVSGASPPFAGNLTFAAQAMAPSAQYVADLDNLVNGGSDDLRNAADAQASGALQHFMDEIALLGLVAGLSVIGTVLVARVLTRSLSLLASRAEEVHNGNFGLRDLDQTGPREVVTTTAAFNDMTSTLRAVEAKAMALAAEDLTDPGLQTPLPGRTGQALQASIDTLSQRMQEREIQRKLLHDAATHDSMTGLLNRPAVLEYLSNDVARRRQDGESVAVIFVDLDGLKPINDVYGHETGDSAIVSTARALVQATDACDVVGRLGGDEFLVVLCHQHSSEAVDVVGRIRQAVCTCQIRSRDGLAPLEASVGMVIARCNRETDPMTLVRDADQAMYEAKKAARAQREQVVGRS